MILFNVWSTQMHIRSKRPYCRCRGSPRLGSLCTDKKQASMAGSYLCWEGIQLWSHVQLGPRDPATDGASSLGCTLCIAGTESPTNDTWGTARTRSPISCGALGPSYVQSAAQTGKPVSYWDLSPGYTWDAAITRSPISCRALGPGYTRGMAGAESPITCRVAQPLLQVRSQTESPVWAEGFTHLQSQG